MQTISSIFYTKRYEILVNNKSTHNVVINGVIHFANSSRNILCTIDDNLTITSGHINIINNECINYTLPAKIFDQPHNTLTIYSNHIRINEFIGGYIFGFIKESINIAEELKMMAYSFKGYFTCVNNWDCNPNGLFVYGQQHDIYSFNAVFSKYGTTIIISPRYVQPSTITHFIAVAATFVIAILILRK